jgi:2-keto-4-pentenoate hydratase/2-oxohepta-3-ene-1,7-dioic acid hydratase in catechol pathway
MRLATYRDDDGTERACAVFGSDDGAYVVDIATASGGALPTTLVELIARGPAAVAAAAALEAHEERHPLAGLPLLAPIPRPPKLIAVAANYQAHIVEGGLVPVDKAHIVPKLFLKPSTSVLAPDTALQLPAVSSAVDWELELGVVIGARCRDVAIEDALDQVFGYTIVNDVSARRMDWGLADRQPSNWDSFFDWLTGKWVDGFAPMGPWIVTRDEIADPNGLALRLDVNDVERQSATTGEMIFDVAELIAFASRIMTLEPGDVIATGTPAGVGATTEDYLAGGDVMVGWIEGVGTLRTPVVARVEP